jgi:hypothetical protein
MEMIIMRRRTLFLVKIHLQNVRDAEVQWPLKMTMDGFRVSGVLDLDTM